MTAGYDCVTVTIYNSNNIALEDFITSYLIPVIRGYLIDSVDTRRLGEYDEYLNSVPSIQQRTSSGKKIYISTYNIIVGIANNLIFAKQPNNNYVIEINPNEIVPNLVAKFIDIARLINFGGLSLSAYPLFTDTFRFFEDNMKQCYKSYLSRRGNNGSKIL